MQNLRPARLDDVRVVIEGQQLPGRHFCGPDGRPLDDVHVGIQIRRDPHELVRGDAEAATWEIDIDVLDGDQIDFRGPAVQGKRGDRFVYLTWGNVGDAGEFAMFRRAKLMLNRIDPDLVLTARRDRRALVATVRLTDDLGGPRCARVDPPDLRWSLGARDR